MSSQSENNEGWVDADDKINQSKQQNRSISMQSQAPRQQAGGAQFVPFIPKSADRLVVTAKGDIVHKDNDSIRINGGVLPSVPTDEDPLLVVGEERDITDKLGNTGNKVIMTIETGLKYHTGEMAKPMIFQGGIVEYRTNLGRPPTHKKSNGPDSIYMVSYASVGLPIQRYNWVIEEAERVGLTVLGVANAKRVNSVVEKDGVKIQDDYMFFNVNITKGVDGVEYVMKTRGSKNPTRGKLVTLMGKINRNFRGNLCMEMNIKRDPKNNPDARLLSFHLKSIQIVEVTDIKTESLNLKPMFDPTDDDVSDELEQLMTISMPEMASKIDPRSSGKDEKSGGGGSSSSSTAASAAAAIRAAASANKGKMAQQQQQHRQPQQQNDGQQSSSSSSSSSSVRTPAKKSAATTAASAATPQQQSDELFDNLGVAGDDEVDGAEAAAVAAAGNRH